MTNLSPPHLGKKPEKITYHNHERIDEYHWVKAENWQEAMSDPKLLPDEIYQHLEAENAYTDEILGNTEDLQRTLFKEMKGRIKEDESSVPVKSGPFAYSSKYDKDSQYPQFIRTPREGGDEDVILDANTEAEGKPYFSLGMMSHSPNHELLLWSADMSGSEYYDIKVRDLETGEDIDESLTHLGGGAVWANDNKTCFYVWLDESHRPCKIYRHQVGRPREEDVLVYEETDPGFFMGLGKTASENYIIIDCHDHSTSELRLIDANNPTSEPVLIAARKPGVEYSLEERQGQLYFLTNAFDAVDFQVMTAQLAAPQMANWTPLIPHKPGRFIVSMLLFKDWLVLVEKENALPRIVITELETDSTHTIDFEEEAYALGASGGDEFETDELRFSYSSPTTPSQTFDYNMRDKSRILRKTQEVPSGHNPQDYITRRLMATAEDGAEIPITLLYHKDTPLDGTAPLFLYGYGSYGIAMPAGFSTARLSLVDRGMIYAVAHIRGGTDKGYDWYAQTRLTGKMLTFTDFVTCGEYLVEQNFTSRGQIIAMGGSAGGLLMGVAANLAPDLFSAILALVPFVDTLNTMLDDQLPLTPPEWPEWGNPIESKQAYDYILSYSPYDQIKAKPYPAIYASGGVSDPRVTYWEPTKWVARLREHTTSEQPVLLHMNMDAGHGGASGRFDSLKETAREYAFALKFGAGIE